MLIDFIVGTRPNFIKLSPIIKHLKLKKFYKKINYRIIHTGQHYDKNLSKIFFEELGITKPSYHINSGSGTHSLQTSKIMIGYEEYITKNKKPDLCIVFGDVNSTLACSLVAKKASIKLGHIEAGLRSFDNEMPEEINRIVTDSNSDYFFVTEDSGKENLIKEGQDNSKIFFVGNLMIDSLHYGLNKIKTKKVYSSNNYGLVTLHRPSNVDNIDTLKEILDALSEISNEIKLFFSIHPRTQKKIDEHKIVINGNIEILEPLPYLDFLHLMRDSKIVFTDSGGIQEELTVLKIPCYTLRENTERPITINQGTNHLVGIDKKSIVNSFKKNKYSINSGYKLPYRWDGRTSKRIVEILNDIIV